MFIPELEVGMRTQQEVLDGLRNRKIFNIQILNVWILLGIEVAEYTHGRDRVLSLDWRDNGYRLLLRAVVLSLSDLIKLLNRLFCCWLLRNLFEVSELTQWLQLLRVRIL